MVTNDQREYEKEKCDEYIPIFGYGMLNVSFHTN